MNSLALVGRLLLSLAVVLGVMWLIARRVRKSHTKVGKSRNNKLIDVLGRQQLTRSSSVAVVRVLDKALIVGVTDGQVSVLGDADLAEIEEQLQMGSSAKPALSSLLATKTTPKPQASRPSPRPSPGPAARSTLSGSALSPATWRATVNSIRDLTVRTR